MARNSSKATEVEEFDHIRISNDVANTPAFFEFVLNVMNSENEVDTEELCKKFDSSCERKRTVGGKELTYVPSKFIKDRLNNVLDCKYSFFILREERVTDPLPRYDRNSDEYTDSDCYIKVTGCLVILGFGVQVAYGVKKTYGYGESDDWKAAATDAFKKCCSMFGIEADYNIEDNVDDEGGRKRDLDLDDVEYDDDSLAEALETEVTFGKFKNLTLEEIYDEDPSYVEWLAENARDEDMQEAAAIVLKYNDDQNSSKKKSAKSKTSGSKKKSGSSSKSSKSSSSRNSKSSRSSSRKKAEEEEEDEVDDEVQELIDSIEEIFEEDEYDDVTKKQLIQSVSTSKRNSKGKSKLSQLSQKELEALLEVLVEDDEDEEDDE